MLESEFRDWARRAQGDFNERLKALETRVAALDCAPLRMRAPEHRREFEGLLSRVKEEVASGRVTGLGVVSVRDDGVVKTGWVAEGFDEYALAGAVGQLSLAILDRASAPDLAEGEAPGGGIGSSAAGAAQGETDEGKPRARESVGSAPAGVA